jgi:hypothetical protein
VCNHLRESGGAAVWPQGEAEITEERLRPSTLGRHRVRFADLVFGQGRASVAA